MKIEKNIPIPSRNSSDTGISSTLKQCNIGDSFLYEGKFKSCYQSARQIGMRVAIRKESSGKYRIWRVA